MYDFLLSGTRLLSEVEGRSQYHDVVRLWFYIVLLIGTILVLMASAKKGLNSRVFKNPLLSLFEQSYLFVENMCLSAIGPHGKKYIPMMYTYWLVIFCGNIMALFFPYSPTADLSFNLGMALIAVGYVQYQGIQANGFFGHVKHFTGPKLTGVMVILSGMIFIIEIISELMKNLSLSLRLYGNIHGGHVAVEKMNELGHYIPLGELLLPIKGLTCIVQPLIFTLLTCIYISLATHHEEDHESHGPEAIMAAQH